jgi:hypothetical protein
MQLRPICVEPDRNVRRLPGGRRPHAQHQARFKTNQTGPEVLQPGEVPGHGQSVVQAFDRLFREGGLTLRLGSQSDPRAQKEWEVVNVCRLHELEQGMPKGPFSSSTTRPGHGPHRWLWAPKLFGHLLRLSLDPSHQGRPACHHIHYPLQMLLLCEDVVRVKKMWGLPTNGACNPISMDKSSSI